jgi:mannose-1-phosphate guanylyltransferase
MVFANGRSQRLIVTIGLEDMTVVDTGDVLLVCSKERAQDVRQIVAMLREQGKTEYL